MHKITVLTMVFMGSVCGMDREPVPQKQDPQQSNLETLRQDQDTLFSQIPTDLFPAMEIHKVAKEKEMQLEVNQASTLDKLINLAKTDEAFKFAPLYLDLRKYRFTLNDERLKEITELFSNLTVLSLYDCYQITDVGLANLQNLSNLNYLDLTNCY